MLEERQPIGESPDEVTKRERIRRQLAAQELPLIDQVSLPKMDLRRLVAKSRAHRRLQTFEVEAANAVSRFYVQVKQSIELSDLEEHIAKHLGLTDANQSRSSKQNLEFAGVYLEELFPGARTKSASDAFTRFFILTFIVPPESLDWSPYDVAYALRSQLAFAHVRPILVLRQPMSARLQPPAPSPEPDPGPSGPPPSPSEPFDCAWSLRYMKVPAAWALTPPAGGAPCGAGILIGHPDTGWHPHFDVNANVEINTALGWNTLDLVLPWQRHNAVDPLQAEILEFNRGHGTTCASVAVSRGGITSFDPTRWYSGTELDSHGNRVAGVAPAASIVPIRCTNQVVILETVNPAFERALHYAIFDANVDVISCSLGVGVSPTPTPSLLLLIAEAVSRNIIFVAAAGQTDLNIIPIPAALPGVIAVTGSTKDGGHVGNSGRKVEIAAPGLNIYEASFSYPPSSPPQPIRERLPNPATSFATAQFAGIAALWLAFHGKQNLLNKYPNTPLFSVFRSLLPQSVTPPPGWDTVNCGPGIIDAVALLSQPLPAMHTVASGQPLLPATVLPLQHLFPQVSTAEILARFSAVFDTPLATTETLLEAFQDEITSIFTMHESAFRLFAHNPISARNDSTDRIVSLVQDIHALILLHGSHTLQVATRDGQKVASDLGGR